MNIMFELCERKNVVKKRDIAKDSQPHCPASGD